MPGEMMSWISREQIGAALVHFTWQAGAIGVLASVALSLSRRCSPQARYLICYVALGMMLLAPCATVLLTPSPLSRSIVSPGVLSAPLVEKTDATWKGEYIGTYYRQRATRISETNTGVSAYTPYLTTCWLIGVIVVSLYHFIGFVRLRRVARRVQALTDTVWEARLRDLAGRMRLSRPIRIVTSAHITAPAVLGCFKPVLLLPVAFFAGMDPKYIEAIVLHELAHIRRYDYLLNLLQVVIETLGFFHPAVWWLSGRIRDEREECCDAVAVAVTGDRLSYAKSLLYLEEQRIASAFALAAGGGDLLRRVSRILGHRRASRSSSLVNAVNLGLTAISLVLLTAFTVTARTDTPDPTREESDRIVQSLTANQVAYYPFDGDARDASGLERHGSVYAATLTDDRFGRMESAFDFNGHGAHIVTDAWPAGPGSVTVSCWIYPRRSGAYESWVARMMTQGSWTSQWRVGFGESKDQEWGLTQARRPSDKARDVWMNYWATSSAIPLGRWSQVSVVADADRRLVSMYVNGRKTAEIGDLQSLETSSSRLLIGYQTDDNVFFDGKIDEVRVYDRALDDRELFALFNSD